MYYWVNYFRLLVPKRLYRARLRDTLVQLDQRSDRDYIERRVNYYNKFDADVPLNAVLWKECAIPLCSQSMCRQKVYFFDTFEYTRWFSGHLLWSLCEGDVTFVPPIPSIVKSRPLTVHNENSVLLKLDKVRHFIFVKDKLSFKKKADKIVFRGKIGRAGYCKFQG